MGMFSLIFKLLTWDKHLCLLKDSYDNEYRNLINSKFPSFKSEQLITPTLRTYLLTYLLILLSEKQLLVFYLLVVHVEMPLIRLDKNHFENPNPNVQTSSSDFV